MTSYLAPELDPRLVEAAELVAQSFMPDSLESFGNGGKLDNAEVVQRLRELPLPRKEWFNSAVAAVVSTILGQGELREAIDDLGRAGDDLELYGAAWVYAGMLGEQDFAKWTVEILGDPLSNSIIDNTGDYDLDELVMGQIDDWIDSAIYAHLRTQIAQLAVSIKNEAGQNSLEVLEAAGLLG